jgi:hypothetical protein
VPWRRCGQSAIKNLPPPGRGAIGEKFVGLQRAKRGGQNQYQKDQPYGNTRKRKRMWFPARMQVRFSSTMETMMHVLSCDGISGSG